MRARARPFRFVSNVNDSGGTAVGHVIFALLALAATVAIAMTGPWPI
jgi:acyl-coenzyme A thioesterase PaaI-like protein